MSLLSLIRFKLNTVNSLENIFKIIDNGKSLGVLSHVSSSKGYIAISSSKQAFDLLLTEYKNHHGLLAINYLGCQAQLSFYLELQGNLEFSIVMSPSPKYSLLEGSRGAVNLPLNYEQYIKLGLAICKNIPITEMHLSII